MMQLRYATYSSDQGTNNIAILNRRDRLERDFPSIRERVESDYLKAIEAFNKTACLSFLVLTVVFIISGFFALLESHRISVALYRLKNCTYMLSHDIPPYLLRRCNEFRKIAELLENPILALKGKGMLE
jgi:hypothetical protein